jgi:hypothetical protein
MSQPNNPTEISWYEASYKYNMMLAMHQNIKSIASASINTNQIRRSISVYERERSPDIKTISELTPTEIMQRVDCMNHDLVKLFEFIKQIIEKQ